MKLSKEKIDEIVGDLGCGMICYVNKETKEILTSVDRNEIYECEELWQETFDEIDNNPGKYIEIEKMPSYESFKVMEDFTEMVTDEKLQKRLIYALNKGKPFKNFKYEIDYDGTFREEWFEFRSKRNAEWVKRQLIEPNEEEE